MCLCGFQRGRLARAELLVYLKKCFLLIFGNIFFDGCFNSFVIAEEFTDFSITAKTECTKKSCDKNFAVFINSYIEKIIGIRFIFKPCTAVRNYSICK